MDIDMSRLKNGLKGTVLTQSAIFFPSDTLKVTGSTISTPKSYEQHPRQLRSSMGVPPPPRATHTFLNTITKAVKK